MGDDLKVAEIKSVQEGSHLILMMSGHWSTYGQLPAAEEAWQSFQELDGIDTIKPVLADGSPYDSSLASFLLELSRLDNDKRFEFDLNSLPDNLVSIVGIACQASHREEDLPVPDSRQGMVEGIGRAFLQQLKGSLEIATFTGEWTIALLRLFRGKAKIRWEDFWKIMKSVSTDALPIVALISFLVGVIISFLGAVTLKQFGAEFAVAYLVGFGILREMGAIMTGVIMAGRSGAAFAAQIGSMKINEEIDALKTIGISPIEFIVLPRLLALFIMMPILTLYSNVIGILSGWLVAEGMMGVPGPVFFAEMQKVLYIGDFLLGLFKAGVFGILVATAGCLRGLQSGSGADAVGVAATRAVVAGITLIVFSNAIIDWAAATLGI